MGRIEGSRYERLVRYQRAWAERRGLADRPWFVLGAAPQPTIPPVLPERAISAYVKYAGHSAAMMGLPRADLTLILKKTTAEDIRGLDLGQVLRLRRGLSLRMKTARQLRYTGLAEGEITHTERDAFILHTLGSLFPENGPEVRPSNGVALICYALAIGVPEVIVAGISLDSEGHAYNQKMRPRRHREQDRAALKHMAKVAPQVSTTEEALHRATGLPLYR